MKHVNEKAWLKEKTRNNSHLTPEISEEEKEAIISFLKSGTVAVGERSGNKDIFDPTVDSRFGPRKSLVTDGTWAWTEQLEYYIRKYSFAPPPDFLEYMKSVGYRVNLVPFDKIDEAIKGKYREPTEAEFLKYIEENPNLID